MNLEIIISIPKNILSLKIDIFIWIWNLISELLFWILEINMWIQKIINWVLKWTF
jgi:hypothetical protein